MYKAWWEKKKCVSVQCRCSILAKIFSACAWLKLERQKSWEWKPEDIYFPVTFIANTSMWGSNKIPHTKCFQNRWKTYMLIFIPSVKNVTQTHANHNLHFHGLNKIPFLSVSPVSRQHISSYLQRVRFYWHYTRFTEFMYPCDSSRIMPSLSWNSSCFCKREFSHLISHLRVFCWWKSLL